MLLLLAALGSGAETAREQLPSIDVTGWHAPHLRDLFRVRRRLGFVQLGEKVFSPALGLNAWETPAADLEREIPDAGAGAELDRRRPRRCRRRWRRTRSAARPTPSSCGCRRSRTPPRTPARAGGDACSALLSPGVADSMTAGCAATSRRSRRGSSRACRTRTARRRTPRAHRDAAANGARARRKMRRRGARASRSRGGRGGGDARRLHGRALAPLARVYAPLRSLGPAAVGRPRGTRYLRTRLEALGMETRLQSFKVPMREFRGVNLRDDVPAENVLGCWPGSGPGVVVLGAATTIRSRTRPSTAPPTTSAAAKPRVAGERWTTARASPCCCTRSRRSARCRWRRRSTRRSSRRGAGVVRRAGGGARPHRQGAAVPGRVDPRHDDRVQGDGLRRRRTRRATSPTARRRATASCSIRRASAASPTSSVKATATAMASPRGSATSTCSTTSSARRGPFEIGAVRARDQGPGVDLPHDTTPFWEAGLPAVYGATIAHRLYPQWHDHDDTLRHLGGELGADISRMLTGWLAGHHSAGGTVDLERTGHEKAACFSHFRDGALTENPKPFGSGERLSAPRRSRRRRSPSARSPSPPTRLSRPPSEGGSLLHYRIIPTKHDSLA